jgi:hypothetical protein
MMSGGMGPCSTLGGGVDGLALVGSSSTGATEQPIRLPTIAANTQPADDRATERNGRLRMALILLEALLALLLFVLIVWWTMFSGRSKGELPPADKTDPNDKAP